MIPTLFLILATLGVLSALGTVLARNLVHAALSLASFFFLVACLFVLLEAEFLAAAQVLISVGAVAVLMMFGIMLTRNIQGDDTTAVGVAWRIPAALACLGFLAVIALGISTERGMGRRRPWADLRTRPAIGPAPALRATPRARAIDDMGRALGDDLMGRYALPFEVAGLLLTAALVGSVALACQDADDDPDGRAVVGRPRRAARPTEVPEAGPASLIP